YGTEKSLRDLGDKVRKEDRAAAESAAAELRAALASEDPGLIKSRMEALQRAAYTLAEEVYKDASARAQAESRTDKGDKDGGAGDNADSNGGGKERPGKGEKASARARKGGEDGPQEGADDVDYEVVE